MKDLMILNWNIEVILAFIGFLFFFSFSLYLLKITYKQKQITLYKYFLLTFLFFTFYHLFEAISYLFLNIWLKRLAMICVSASFISLILNVDLISKESVTDLKLSFASLLFGATIVLTFVPGTIEMYNHKVWGYPTLGMKGFLQIFIIFITFLLCCQLCWWLFQTWRKAPTELKKKAFWMFFSSIVFYIHIIFLFLFGIWLLIPIIYIFTTISMFIAGFFIIKEPKLLYILSFSAQYLTIINKNNLEPIFELSWQLNQIDSEVNHNLYIEWALLIEQLRNKIPIHGHIQKINLDKSVLNIVQGKYVTGLLLSNKSSVMLRISLEKCIETFDLKYEKYFKTGLVDPDNFNDAIDIINRYFPLGLISAQRSTELLKNHIDEIVKQRTQELELITERLKESDKAKTLFLATVNHELRTPLNSILGFLELILSGHVGSISDEVNDYLKMVYESSQYLLNLINTILDISKIEANKLDMFFEDFLINDIIGQVIETLSSQSLKKEIQIHKQLDINYKIYSDKNRLKQILFNLLGNAIKFTPKNGKITIKTKIIDKKKVKISILDDGIGIAEENLEKLFKPFQQIHPSNSDDNKGSGLGLYLTKKLIELLGGNITVESEIGKGSEFSFKIPIKINKKIMRF